MLSLYRAVLFRVVALSPSLRLWVVDFDGKDPPYQTSNTIVGPSVTGTARRIIASRTHRLGCTIRPTADFNNDPVAVRQSVYDEHAWAAIIVNPNPMFLLRSALSKGNTTYGPTGAGQMVLNSVREPIIYAVNIEPALSRFGRAAQSQFGPRWVHALISESLNIPRVPRPLTRPSGSPASTIAPSPRPPQLRRSPSA